MKNKICLFLVGLLIFIPIFSFIELKSFATTIEPVNVGFSNGQLKYDVTTTQIEAWQYDITENSSYDRSGIVCWYVGEYEYNNQTMERWQFATAQDLINSFSNANEPFAYCVYEVKSVATGEYIIDPTNQNWKKYNVDSGVQVNVCVSSIFSTDFPVFNDVESAIEYFRYNLLDEDSIRYGSEYLSDSMYTEQVYDPEQIPAPTVEWVTDQYGNFTHKLHFLNNGYFGEHNTQLNYGLLLEMHWLSVNAGELSLINNTSNLNTKYKFTASSFCQSDQISIYTIPSLGDRFNFSEYECPPYLDLDQNGLAINGFNSMLSAYPVSGRNLTAVGGFNNSSSILNNVIKTGLGQISYRMNCPSVSCQYFVIGEDNKLYKGPITQIHIGFPNPSYFSDTGTMTSYEPSTSQDFNPESGEPITPPTTTNPPSAPNPGVQDPYQVPDYTDVNATELVSNMTSLFSFVRQMPDFMRIIFSFLPEWLLVFIAVAVGIVIAIGVVKIFVG